MLLSWPRIVATGFWLEFIALRPVLRTPHDALATEVHVIHKLVVKEEQ